MERPSIGADRPLLTGLTGIRALAAAWVVIDHFSEPLFGLFPWLSPLAPWVHGGFLGVEVFFILSGFIIAYNYADRFAQFSGKNFRRFILLRLARIYPVHLVSLLVVGALVIGAAIARIPLNFAQNFTPANFVANLLMLQAVPPFVAFNAPAWSICAEFGAYLVFPLIALVLVRIRSAAKAFAWSAVFAAVGVTAMLLTLPHVEGLATAYPIEWMRISTEFTMGCLLYAGWRFLGERQQGKRWDVAAVASVVAVFAIVGVTGGTSYGIVSTPFIAVFVLACAGATGPVGRVLSGRFMIWGGKVSYSVYMSHFVVLLVVGKVLPWERFAEHGPVVGAGVLISYYAASLAAGAGLYHFIEEPSRKAIRRLMERNAETRAAKQLEVV